MNKYNFNNELLLLLEEFPNEDYKTLSRNPNITMEHIKSNPDKN